MNKKETVLDLLAILFVIALLGFTAVAAIDLLGTIVVFYFTAYITLSFALVKSFARIDKMWHSRKKKSGIK